MVIDLADPNSRSAGSCFKNPIVEKSKFDTLNGGAGGNVPSFDAGPGHVKIPAAWLIENAGFYKGFRSGNAGISSNHALALINRGGATAGEIMDLKSQIQAAVESKFGIRLQPEPVLLGFEE
jgi:UDP-N-acetylmuramate dehydrogenase